MRYNEVIHLDHLFLNLEMWDSLNYFNISFNISLILESIYSLDSIISWYLTRYYLTKSELILLNRFGYIYYLRFLVLLYIQRKVPISICYMSQKRHLNSSHPFFMWLWDDFQRPYIKICANGERRDAKKLNRGCEIQRFISSN